MCDFSLQAVRSRPAKVADKLVTKDFHHGTRGFACVDDLDCAVCVMPGTEIAFDKPIKKFTYSGFFATAVLDVDTPYNTAIFRQVNKDVTMAHHDVIEMPNGEQILLTALAEGQHAVILQLPAAPKNEQEVKDQTRAEFVG